MRVAVVHSFYSTSQPSGENSVVVDQATALMEAGHEVLLLSRHTDDEQTLSLYPLRAAVRVASGRGPDPSQRLRAFRPDIVHVHNLFPNIGSAWLSDWTGPVVASVHNYRLACANGLLFRDGEFCRECPDLGPARAVVHKCYRGSTLATVPVAVSRHREQRRLLSRADAVVTTSRGSDETLRSVIPVPMRTVVIPNAGADDGCAPLPASERSGWVAMGRLTEEKGLLELAQQWPASQQLTIIGDGPQERSVRDEASRRGIDFLPSMPREELRARLPHFTGLVFPSRWTEAAPQVAVEAMRVGLPIVALDRNVVAEVVEDSGAGRVYSDADSLATAVAEVSSACDHHSARASSYYAATWRPSIWLAAIERLYAELAGAPS